MGKTSEVRSDGAGAEMQGEGVSDSGPPQGRKSRKRHDSSDGQRAGTTGRRRDDGGPDADASDGIDAAEHLQQDFAKVRAKAATDPVVALRSFSAAWTTDLIEEEDEAEFVDAVADCLGAGFSLESALTGWDNGTLAADGVEEASLFDDDLERDEESQPAFAPRHTPSGGRRIVMS